MPRSGPCAPRGRAEPAPPRGGPSRARWPWGGKPWDNAKGGFLGGTRSPRPRGKAVRKPRHNMIIGSKGTPGGLMGPCVGQARAFPSGVRSPLLRGETKPGGKALRGNAGDDAKGVFLGGTRSPRPHRTAVRMPRHSIPAGSVQDRPLAKRGNVGVSVMPSFRACGALPSAGWAIQGKMALGRKTLG